MKTFRTVAGTLALAAHLLAAQAQAPAAKPARTAAKRAAAYQGPKVVPDSKALARKMVQKSNPTDMHQRIPVKVN